MRKLLFFMVLAVSLAACEAAPTPTPLPTETPRPTDTPTPTVVWFPPTETPTLAPPIVRTPTPDLRASLGALLVDDDFSSDADWSLATTASSSAAIANGHLTLALSRSNSYLLTTRKRPSLSDFYAEMTANPNLCSGRDEYGLMVRVTPSLNYFRLSLSCDGRAKVDRIFRGVARSIVPWTYNGSIPASAPSSVELAVWAVDEELRFYVNGFYLFAARDTALYYGGLGVYVHTTGDSVISVNFTDLKVWQVEQ